MSAEYLVRFDDMCPTMRWSVWERIEPILIERLVRPVLAVVPENRDPDLRIDDPRPDFWDRVRGWHARGWTIALQPGGRSRGSGRAGGGARGDLVGRPEPAQREALGAAVDTLTKQGVAPSAFAASHRSYDRVTLALLREFGITTVIGGHSLFPYRDRDGMVWVPQQLDAFERKARGVWTVRLRHNAWGTSEVEAFGSDMARHGDRVTDLTNILAAYSRRSRTVTDRLFAARLRAGMAVGRKRG